jgi:membrane protease subunit (stomatin/prohibitin family)
MGTRNAIFLEILEWFDDTGQELVHRIPETGSGDIKYGAQLTVRESQAAAFFYQGKAIEAFGPGRHTLKTANIPILTKVASLPWGFTSPLRAEVYFVNMKVFTNLKWGTRDPVAFKDSELGLVRLRAFGVYNVQVLQPALFINTMVGTQNTYTTEGIGEYLSRVIVSRFNDYMGQTLDSILNLPAKYDELSEGLVERLQNDFAHFGLGLTHLYINSLTPPPEVQKAIDDRSRLAMFDDMNKLMQMKAAMAMEEAASAQGTAGAAAGMGVGMIMPAMFSQYLAGAQAAHERSSVPTGPPGQVPESKCPECEHPVPADARFCQACGHQILVFTACANCGKNLAPNAKFCSRCGHPAEEKPQPKICPQCSGENLPGALFCNQCGEKLS